MHSHLDVQRAGAGRYRTRAWVAGYLAQMDGLGDECPHKPNSAEAIDWTDGHGEALQALRLLLDE